MPRNETKGVNPFDRFGATRDVRVAREVRKVAEAHDMLETQAEIQRQTKAAFESGQRYREAWETHQANRHLNQLRQAEEVVPVEVRRGLQINQAEQNRLDDDRFGWVKCYDQLLQLHDHEEYLRAYRSFERRMKRAKATGSPIPAPWSGNRVWTIVTLVFFIVLILGAASESVIGALFLVIICLPLWSIMARLPAIVGGLDNTGRGGSNAV